MTDVFQERVFDTPLTPSDIMEMAGEASNCFGIHKVEWRMSFLSADGTKMVCWFNSRDAESARLAMRESGADISVVWPGTVHDAPHARDLTPNVLVIRNFDEPVELKEIQAKEDKGAWCLETYQVRFCRTFFSQDRKRMICLYQAPDAESVRLAQRQAQMPLIEVRSFQPILPG